MTTLWLKFPDDVLFSRDFTDKERQTLESVFSDEKKDSQWLRALHLIKLKPCKVGDDPLVYWHGNAPYFNWSVYAKVISGGTIDVIRTPDGGYNFSYSYKPKNIFAFLKSQWRISRFLADTPKTEDPIVHSIALGIIVQGLILRFGSDSEHLVEWLGAPDKAPKSYKKTIQQIQATQMQRTSISDTWKTLFTSSADTHTDTEHLPAFFWGDDIPAVKKPQIQEQAQAQEQAPSQQTENKQWHGKTVHAGLISGLAVATQANHDKADLIKLKEQLNAPLVLVFKNARPDTVELFPYADALVFGTGGALSHACTVARDRAIPTITAVGQDLFDIISNSPDPLWVTIDANTSTITSLDAPPSK